MLFSAMAVADLNFPNWMLPAENIEKWMVRTDTSLMNDEWKKNAVKNKEETSFSWKPFVADVSLQGFPDESMRAMQQLRDHQPIKFSDRMHWLNELKYKLEALNALDDEGFHADRLPVKSLIGLMDDYHLKDVRGSQSKKAPATSLMRIWLARSVSLLQQEVHYGMSGRKPGMSYGLKWHTRGIRLQMSYRF